MITSPRLLLSVPLDQTQNIVTKIEEGDILGVKPNHKAGIIKIYNTQKVKNVDFYNREKYIGLFSI